MSDRYGIVAPLAMRRTVAWTAVISQLAMAPNLTTFAMAQLIVGLGTSASFAPLMVDISRWFVRAPRHRRRRRRFRQLSGRHDLAADSHLFHRHARAGGRCISLSALYASDFSLPPPSCCASARRRRRTPTASPAIAFRRNRIAAAHVADPPGPRRRRLLRRHGDAAGSLVAYCADLGYGAARGAEMLSLMLGLGVVSRVLSGHDRRPDWRPGAPC